MRLIGYLLVNTLAVLISSYIIPGVRAENLFTAISVAVVLGILNSFLRPILIFLTLPINIISLGLFTLVINAILIQIAGHLVSGFAVSGFFPALLFSLVMSLVGSFLGSLTREGNKR